MRVVVTGTDTGVGKTIVSAAIARPGAAYVKPAQTGDDDDAATVQELSGNELMFQYDRSADNGSLLSIKALNIADISLGRSGACHAHFRILRDGTVSGVSFSGTTFSFSGPYGDCASLIRECVEQPDRTQLPPQYDIFSILLKGKSK